jgi:hypothetical protein
MVESIPVPIMLPPKTIALRINVIVGTIPSTPAVAISSAVAAFSAGRFVGSSRDLAMVKI